MSSDYSYSQSGDYSYSESGYSGSYDESSRTVTKRAKPTGRARAASETTYGYSYSYTDDGSYSGSTTEARRPRGTAGGLQKAKPPDAHAKVALPAVKSNVVEQTREADSYEYSYSGEYSYTGYSDDSYSGTEEPTTPGRSPGVSGAADAAAQRKGTLTSASKSASKSVSMHDAQKSSPSVSKTATRKDAGASGSDEYSYSYSDEYSDYSYSGRTSSYGYSSYSYDSYEVSLDPRKSRVSKGKGAAATDSYSGSYSYSESASSGLATKGGRNEKRRAPGGGGQSDSYSYSGYDSYSYSYSDSGSAGRDSAALYSTDSYSYPDYYYYSSGGKSDTSPSYFNENGATHSDSYGYSYTASDSYSDYSLSSTGTARVGTGTSSGTTASYDYSSEASSRPFGRTHDDVRGAAAVARELLVWRTPAKDVPKAPPPPKRCFVARASVDDVVHVFLDKLMVVQTADEAVASGAAVSGGQGEAADTPATTQTLPAAPPSANPAAGDATTGTQGVVLFTAEETSSSPGVSLAQVRRERRAEEKRRRAEEQKRERAMKKERLREAKAMKGRRKETESAAGAPAPAPTPVGCYSARSVRMALSTLQLTHMERREALRGLAVPMPRETLERVLNECVTTRVRERVAQTFLAHDPFRRGEMPLAEVADIFRRLGIARSPVIGGVRVNVDASERTTEPEIVMTVEVRARPSLSTEAERSSGQDRAGVDPLVGAAGPQGESVERPPQLPPRESWVVHAIPVCRILRENIAAKQPTSVTWREQNIYMGRYCVCRGVAVEADYQRLKSHMEAATYLCVLTQLCSVAGEDAEQQSGGAPVLYPHLLRALLLLTPPSQARKVLYTESLFSHLYSPMERLAASAAAKGLEVVFDGQAGVESTLHATIDTLEKRRRNVMPVTLPDQSGFVMPAPTAGDATARPAGDVVVSFALQKVRVASAAPAGARCFCLVSAVSVDNVFLPAVEVAAVDVRASSKKSGGFTWNLADKKSRKGRAAVIYAGPSTDRLYIECCYETTTRVTYTEEAGARVGASSTGGSREGGGSGDPTAAEPVSRVEDVTTVWCAGYALLPLRDMKTTTVPVRRGSLLDEADSQPQGGPSPATVPAEVAERKRRSGFLACLWANRKRKGSGVALAPVPATEVKVEVLKTDVKRLPQPQQMPRRFLILERHAAVVPLVRAAIASTGRQCSHAAQALRQQFITRSFDVASDSGLLDQLAALWSYKVDHMDAAQRADSTYLHQQMMLCTTMLSALSSLTSKGRAQLADLVIQKQALVEAFDEHAPMKPVAV